MPLDFNEQSHIAEIMRQTQPHHLFMLTDFTKAGVMPDLSDPRSRELLSALDKSSRVDWSKTYADAKAALTKELSSLKPFDNARAAQLRLAAEELELINKSPADLREPLITEFRENDEKYVRLRTDAEKVYKEIDPNGYELDLYRQQDQVIADVDGISLKPLQLELESANKALANESNSRIAKALQHDKDDVLSAMIAPFFERCRGAAIEDLDNNFWYEEKYWKSAMEKLPSLPAQTWQLQSNCQFRDAMTADYKRFLALQNLPSEFEGNLPKLDLIDHNGCVTRQELNLAAATHNPGLTPLIEVLKSYYDELTAHHVPLLSKDGISLDDVKAFDAKRRGTKPNSASHLGR